MPHSGSIALLRFRKPRTLDRHFSLAGGSLPERQLCRFLRCGRTEELCPLHLDSGNSGFEFFAHERRELADSDTRRVGRNVRNRCVAAAGIPKFDGSKRLGADIRLWPVDARSRPSPAIRRGRKQPVNESSYWPPWPVAREQEQPWTLDYWITSSARTNTDCGIVRPSDLAVSRLMTSSTFVGNSIGRSEGLRPC